MKFTRRLSFLVPATIILIAAFSSFGQTKRPDFNRASTFDAQHYTIRASFDRPNKKVIGDTTVYLKPLTAGFKAFDLDAVGLVFESVKLDPAGTDLTYKAAPASVHITLDRAYSPDETVAVRFRYSATPKKGVYFVDGSSNEGAVHSAQIWSQGEADEARHWFPAFDFPSDKATTEEYITANKDEVVIGNGNLLGKEENADGTVTWHYKMPVPHSVYLVSFVIGNYSRVDDKYGDIPLGFYVYPGREETARRAFGDTKKMIAVYEDLTGVKFPYNKYDQSVVASFQFGGMENITATTMADTEIFFADFDFGKSIVVDLVSHELAHSWFGDMVTCKNWAELWLNEGFATYMEAAYREKTFGQADYIRKIKADAAEFLIDDLTNKKRHPLYDVHAGDVAGLFDNASTTYHKGGAVIHTLREQVGTEAFWKGINIYLNRHRFANVESTDLRAAMEEASGQDLGWFFDQWVYGGGAPRLDVKPTYRSRTRTLTLAVSQTQLEDAMTASVFRLPMDINIKTAAGTAVQRIEMTKRVQTFTIKLAGKPDDIQIDEKAQIPIKRLKIRPVITLR